MGSKWRQTDKTAFEIAKELGIVPKFEDYKKPELDKNTYRDNFRTAILKMRAELRAYIEDNFDVPPVPGPRPDALDRPELPSMAASRDECVEWAKKNDNWLDVEYWPGEAERVVWELARTLHAEREIELRAKALTRIYNLKRWGMRVLKIGIGGALLAGCTWLVLGVLV